MDNKILELISRRRRQILVHSFLYYQLNESLIDDYTFDTWSRELVNLQSRYPTEAMKSVYAKEFKGFDGSSGYDLPYSRMEIQTVGHRLLKFVKRYK
jgi:NAD-dependent DNA ligase adenylation domain